MKPSSLPDQDPDPVRITSREFLPNETVPSLRAIIGVARVPADPVVHEALAGQWLGAGEHARCARFKVDHARRDFLAGRLAAKRALDGLARGAPPPSRWELQAGENQRPDVSAVFPGCVVTLAHTAGLGLAVAHDARWFCGVDLEPAERDAGEVIATQVSATEVAWARAGGAEQRVRWMLLWTAREALGKGLGTGLLEPALLQPTVDWQRDKYGWVARFAGDGGFVVRAVVAGGFVAALVLRGGTGREPAIVATAGWLATTLLELR